MPVDLRLDDKVVVGKTLREICILSKSTGMAGMLKSTTDRQWENWANSNPYLGVLGIESDDISNESTRQKFFASGEEQIAKVIGLIDTHLGGLAAKATALDFGCGVGRLVRPLASRFDSVTGIDVAPKMLEIAQENTADFSNVIFASSLADIVRPGEGFDLVHSYIVLQHIRPDQGLPIIRDLIATLKPGGVFALHFTTGDSHQLRSALNWVRYRVRPAHWAYNVARKRPWNEPITEMNRYDVFTVLETAEELGCEGAFAVPFNQNGHKGIMLIGMIGTQVH